MDKTWKTKDGDEIPYSQIETDHLKNIIKMIELNAEKGVRIGEMGGGNDPDSFWYEPGEIVKGKKYLKLADYQGL